MSRELQILKRGAAQWNAWRESHPDVQPVLKGETLAGIDLRDYDLSKADLAEADLSRANLSRANLTQAGLHKANLREAVLDQAALDFAGIADANLEDADLTKARLIGANLAGASLNRATLRQAELRKASFGKAILSSANLSDADLSQAQLGTAVLSDADVTGANLTEANLTEAILSRANLSGACLSRARLSGADLGGAILRETDFSEADVTDTRWGSSVIDAATNFTRVRFGPNHPVMSDRSDTVQIKLPRWHIRWSMIRWIQRVPVFGVSWIALGASLALINTIGFVNNDPDVSRWIPFRVPFPLRSQLIVASSLLLVIAATLFRWACPDRIQNCSESEWVEVQGHSRLMYVSEDLKRPVRALLTLALTWLGGLVALGLMGDFLWRGVRYIY